MAKPHRAAGDIEIAENMAFQRRAWSVRRVGWVIIALVIGAALAGLFGNGPLATVSATSAGGSIVPAERRRRPRDARVLDFVLLLVIVEATQQALLGDDFSLTNAAIVILTLVGLNVLLSEVKSQSRRAEEWLDDTPLILVDEGKLLSDRMRKERIGEDDILHAAREAHGIERLEEIKYAVLERSGGISIVPRPKSG